MLTLKIAEAPAKDVGRGVARLDPKDMAQLGLHAGDTILIKGKRSTVARATPAYAADRGQETIQIDGLLRENAQAGLDEKVEVDRISCEIARSVTLAPVDNSSAFSRETDARYLGRLLEGLPVSSGDKVRATFMGSRYQEFTVAATMPGSPVLIGTPTVIHVSGNGAGKDKGHAGVTYEDIGGLHKEITRIREMIELPLKYPEVFERLGIEAPKGVLLHGPPGCGKTLIARAVANETDAHFAHISGPEIIHKFYGESEAHLRAIFQKASEEAPAIIFLDEIDAIAAKREDIRSDQQVERRVVAQLLALMDGLKSRGQVIVIGATNIPNVLDPALRRPGRFDREISISIPDRNARLNILQIHTRGMPLAASIELEKLADITHGFVGADLEALCREAAMVTLRKIMPEIDFQTGQIPYELLMALEVTMDDFLDALREVEPSAIREVFTEIPSVKWDEVGGLAEAKRALMEAVEWPLRCPQIFQQAHARPAKGILLSGPPGTGKTLLAKAVASETQVNFISVKGPALLSKWVGESEKGVREVFRKARQASPCIIFFDEIDAIAPTRGGGADSHATERVVSQFLTEMDGIEELKGVVVLAATNRPDIIDPALLRAGRFGLRLELPAPDEQARLAIFRIHTRAKPLAADVELGRLAKDSVGLVGAEIEDVCQRATMSAIREFVAAYGLDYAPEHAVQFAISARHFKEAMSKGAPQAG